MDSVARLFVVSYYRCFCDTVIYTSMLILFQFHAFDLPYFVESAKPMKAI